MILDASSLRKQVGKQAVLVNQLAKATNLQGGLRERIGHTLVEIIAGVAVGALVALAIFTLTSRP